MKMTTRIAGAVALLLGVSGPLVAQQTGLEALGVLRRTVGTPAADRVVLLSGRLGAEQPAVWRLVARHPAHAGHFLEYQVQGGRVISESAVPTTESVTYARAPLTRTKLRVDSPVVFWRADTEAKKARIGFDAVDYTLRNAEFSTKPVWVVRLIGQRGATVGELAVSAETGNVLRRTWFEAGRQDRPPPAPPARGPAPAALSGSAQQAWEGTRSGVRHGTRAVQSGLSKASTTVGGWLIRAGGGVPPSSQTAPAPIPAPARAPAAAPPVPRATAPAESRWH